MEDHIQAYFSINFITFYFTFNLKLAWKTIIIPAYFSINFTRFYFAVDMNMHGRPYIQAYFFINIISSFFAVDLNLHGRPYTSLFSHQLDQFLFCFPMQVILISTLVSAKRTSYGDFTLPIWCDVVGWMIVVVELGVIPAIAIYKLVTVRQDLSFRQVRFQEGGGGGLML